MRPSHGATSRGATPPGATSRGVSTLLMGAAVAAIFLNGFEAGGYQACLRSIGEEYELTGSLMGTLASAQLVAGLIAPLVFGPLADKRGKRPMLIAALGTEAAACVLATFSVGIVPFASATFLLGLAVSVVQYVSLAAIADAFPVSGRRKLGFVTGAYSIGAVVSPLVCGGLVTAGVTWRIFFAVLAACAVGVCCAIAACDFSPKEQGGATEAGEGAGGAGVDAGGTSTGASIQAQGTRGAWDGLGVALLCLVMFVYVGVESGIGYFMNSFVGIELGGSTSYLALSLFWAAMIPSRLLCGAQAARRGPLLVAACVGSGVLTASMALLGSPVAAVVLACAMGFFCGAVYPCVLAYVPDFSAEKTATATGLITAATGLGGAVVTLAFGWMSDALGMRVAFALLGAIMLVDVVAATILLIRNGRLRARA